jgi:hypothetical protein
MYYIKRVVGETVLTYDELYTLLTRIEACLNSRPLVSMSNDPDDLTANTPRHFFIGEALTAPLEPDLTELKINRLSRHQLLERLRHHFWKRWRTEYLSYLQSRTKWALFYFLPRRHFPLCLSKNVQSISVRSLLQLYLIMNNTRFYFNFYFSECDSQSRFSLS